MNGARLWLGIGSAYGLLSVVAGALGAHLLRGMLDAGALGTLETAARFHMYHALALLATGLIADRWKSSLINLAGGLFAIGTLLFSGSLYILALTSVSAFGAVAPLGGVSLMAGWLFLAVGVIKHP